MPRELSVSPFSSHPHLSPQAAPVLQLLHSANAVCSFAAYLCSRGLPCFACTISLALPLCRASLSSTGIFSITISVVTPRMQCASCDSHLSVHGACAFNG